MPIMVTLMLALLLTSYSSLSAFITKLYLLPIMLFKPVNFLTFASYSPYKTPRSTCFHCNFLYLGLQSPSLWNSATAPSSMLHQLFETNQKTSASLLILLSSLLILPLLCSPSFMTENRTLEAILSWFYPTTIINDFHHSTLQHSSRIRILRILRILKIHEF